jgi:DNA-damage-inducible protein I
MRIEVTIARTTVLPPGALIALSGEFSRRIENAFPESPGQVLVRYAASNNLSVIGGSSDDKERIRDILQETWESADDWFYSA